MNRTSREPLPIDPEADGVDPAGRLRSRSVLAVGAGGLCGGGARYAVEMLSADRVGAYPWGTLLVNITGSLLIGLLMVLTADPWRLHSGPRSFAAAGVLGSFTTFGSWMVETAQLASHGQAGLAAAHLGGSLVAGLLAAYAGLLLGQALMAAVRR